MITYVASISCASMSFIVALMQRNWLASAWIVIAAIWMTISFIQDRYK